MMSRVVLLVALCALSLSSVSAAAPSRVHGALNRRLTHERMDDTLGSIEPQWMSQKLDHQDLASTVTFQQRYYVNNSFYSPSNPRVFLMIGGEGPVSPAYVTDHFIIGQLASEYSALVCTLEHRFYGASVPNGDSSTGNLKYLSSIQALEDLVSFREMLTKSLSLPSTTTWIVFGGSYSGSLAAWARMKYPHLFRGAFATSAPVQAQLDFKEYFDVVATSVGSTCTANLAASTASLTALLASNPDSVVKMFNLCAPPKSTNDVANLFSTLSGPIAGIVQYNEDNNSYEMYDITKMCSRLEGESSPLAGLVAVWNDYNAFSNNTQCTDIGYDSMIASMQSTSDARSWTWQTCTEFGYFQSAVSNGLDPFSPSISLAWFVQQCADIFKTPGLSPNIEWTNDVYGGAGIVTSNTVFANGDVDPWHVLGNYQSYTPAQQSETILISGTAHCADLYPPRASDVSGLTAARAAQTALLSQWLNDGAAAHAQAAQKHNRRHTRKQHSPTKPM